jgi:hypothetical protein
MYLLLFFRFYVSLPSFEKCSFLYLIIFQMNADMEEQVRYPIVCEELGVEHRRIGSRRGEALLLRA